MELIKPSAVVFIKAGFHGSQSLKAIITRKVAEERNLGFVFWGYSGTLCHPRTQVQPFVNECRKIGNPIKVVMPCVLSVSVREIW